MGKNEQNLDEGQIRQINYTIISIMWELIADMATEINREKHSEKVKKKEVKPEDPYIKYDRKNKRNLYAALSTYDTDYSAIKTGKKRNLTKSMKKAIAEINFKYYANIDKYIVNDPMVINEWENIVKQVFMGKTLIPLHGIDEIDLLKWINREIEDKEQNNIMKKKVNDVIKNIVRHYRKEPQKTSSYFPICVWISLTMQGENNQYMYNMKINDVVNAVNSISLRYLEACDLTILQTQIESLDEEIERWRVIYNYRKLKKEVGSNTKDRW